MINQKLAWIILPISLVLLILNFNIHALKAYVKSGFVASDHFQSSIKQVKGEVVLGFWDVPDRILVAKKFRNGYFLIQRDPGATYMVGRGKNLLKDPRTVLSNKSFSINEIKSKDSQLGGLYEPDNFPAEEVKGLGYRKNEVGEWVKAASLSVKTPRTINGVVSYSLPKGNNMTDWEQFDDLTLPEGIFHAGGYGFPLYGNEKTRNGRVILLTKGFTHLGNLSGLPRSVWDGKNNYYFNQVYFLIKVAARSMVEAGMNGGEYGNISAIANQSDSEGNVAYEGITVKGAIELGRRMYYSSAATNSIDDRSWNMGTAEGMIMLDEESMTWKDWAGGNHYSLLGYLTQGMYEASGGKKKIMWYAQPVTRHFVAMLTKDWTRETVEDVFTDKHILLSSPGWRASQWFTDANGAYSKIPFLSNTDIYEKLNGKIVTDRNGKRKFRNESFTINIYGKPTQVLATPHEYMRYFLSNRKTGEHIMGRQYVDVHADGTASVKEEYKKKGFEWSWMGSRPYPQYWEPETKMWVDGIYRRADGIMSDLLMLAKLEKGKWDITKANVKYKLYGEHRPQTEPWTAFGNSVDVREVGESQIFYDTFMLLLSGGQAASSWDDGFWKNELPVKGSPLYDKDDYWGRYHSKLAAVQTVMKPLEGSKSTDWTYIHFYYPYWGQKNAEVISSGIYFKGKLYVFFLNPTLENGEKQTLTLSAGAFSTSVELNGHEVFYKVFDIPVNLNPKDFKLNYTTIYGRKVKVNGMVTNKISEHYE